MIPSPSGSVATTTATLVVPSGTLISAVSPPPLLEMTGGSLAKRTLMVIVNFAVLKSVPSFTSNSKVA